jgi:hypothetical protein
MCIFDLNSYILFNNVRNHGEKGNSYTFPFSGYVSLGHGVDEKISARLPILKSGQIGMRGKNEIDGGYFLGDTEFLRIGDQLKFPNESVSYGVIAINQEPDIEVNYRTEANEAYIIKPGMKSDSYKVSVSYFDKWKNDKDYQRLSMVFAAIFVFTTLITFIYDTHNYLKQG